MIKGSKHSPEARSKIGIAGRGRKASPETKEKLRLAAKRNNLGYFWLGKKQPEDMKKKRAKSLAGRIGKWNKGKHHSETTKQLMSQRHTGENNHNWKGGRYAGSTMKNRTRRALRMSADGSFTVGEWENLKKQYGLQCPSCGKKEPEIKLTADHVIPLSRGGSNWIENIQPLCRSCNSKKWAKILAKYPIP